MIALAVAPLASLVYEPLVRAALVEDLGIGGDLTSAATIPAGMRARAAFVAREAGRLAGLEFAVCAFRLLDPGARCESLLRDGAELQAGTSIATIECDARALLAAERTALNLLGHLCGIASATADYVRACAGTRCAVSETRKTLPGLRALQKYAVRVGGGANHRFRLDDAVLIKDNHVALAGGITAALDAARAAIGHLVKIEIEVDSLAQFDEALAHGGADAILLDNFAPEDLREAVRRAGGCVTLEASGGVTLASAREIAATGVDVMSIGALTHSVRALDVGLDIAA
ncbi:MAG: carboxylating nicotinate-nucleotide diphosphorylase [Candidatus Eremiobacteraeota bacterium]|nr:carboxylating nicotinate-nucleotide diphosphorylase [Candidatus Eremiobacteraeota bacterium]